MTLKVDLESAHPVHEFCTPSHREGDIWVKIKNINQSMRSEDIEKGKSHNIEV